MKIYSKDSMKLSRDVSTFCKDKKADGVCVRILISFSIKKLRKRSGNFLIFVGTIFNVPPEVTGAIISKIE